MSERQIQCNGHRRGLSVGSRIATVFVVVALSMMAARSASAAPVSFEGVFTYTMDELYHFVDDVSVPGVPGLSVGDTFTGYYRYTAEGVDGIFGLPPSEPGWGPLDLFRVFVPMPLSFQLDGLYEYLNSTVPGPILTVSGGQVTDFFWHNEVGPVGFGFDGGSFHIVNNVGGCPEGTDLGCHARGTYDFSDPQRVPEPSTLLLFSGALGALSVGVFRSRSPKADD
jgi:hypothetical protein